jgi:hypothetical protein
MGAATDYVFPRVKDLNVRLAVAEVGRVWDVESPIVFSSVAMSFPGHVDHFSMQPSRPPAAAFMGSRTITLAPLSALTATTTTANEDTLVEKTNTEV